MRAVKAIEQRRARRDVVAPQETHAEAPRATIDAFAVASAAPPDQLARFDGAVGEVHAALARADGQGGRAVQLRGATCLDGAAVHATARRGTRGSGGALPHQERIQRAFGRHALGSVRAHVGGQARAAVEHMGAEAFAMGDAVAFRSAPSLHMAAHEAAHVIQQRAGVALGDGVGRPGDRYEQHADRVADAVVAGRSAEPLIDQMTGGRGASAASHGVQFGGQGKAPAGPTGGAPSKKQADTWAKLSKQAFNRRTWCNELSAAYGFSLATAGLVVTAIESSAGLWLKAQNLTLAHALAVVISDAAMKYPRAPWLVDAQIAKIAQWARRFGSMATFVTKYATVIKLLGGLVGAVGLAVDVAGVIGGTDGVVAKINAANQSFADAKKAKADLKKLKATDAWIQAQLAKQVDNDLKSGDEASKGTPRALVQGIYKLRTAIDTTTVNTFEMVKEIVNYVHGLIGAASGAAQLVSLVSPATMATLGVVATVVSIVNYLVQNLKISAMRLDEARELLTSIHFKGTGLVTTVAKAL